MQQEHVNSHDVSMVTLPILICLLAEQVYKSFANTNTVKPLSV